MSLIVGPYYKGDPKQKPQQWGNLSDVQSAARHWFDRNGLPYPKIFYPFWEGGNANAYSIGSIAGHASSGVNGWESGALAHGASEAVAFTDTAVLVNTYWSLIFQTQFRGSAGAGTAPLIEFGGVSGGDFFRLISYYGDLRTYHQNNYAGIDDTWADWVTNDPFFYAYVANGSTDHKAYVNTERILNDTSTTVGQGDSWRVDLDFISDSDNDWLVNLFMIFYDALNANQIALLNEQPYGPIIPRSIPIYSFVADGGATTYEYTGSGTVTTSGAAGLVKSKSFSGSGQVGTSGAATLQKEKVFAGSGTVTTSGTAPTLKEKDFDGSGTVSTSGSADLVKEKDFDASGTLTTSGAAAFSKTKAATGSGQVTVSGAAVTELDSALSNYIYAGSGAVAISGAADLAKEKDFDGSGQVTVSGSAVASLVQAGIQFMRAALSVGNPGVSMSVSKPSATMSLKKPGGSMDVIN